MPFCTNRRKFLKVASTSAATFTILQAGSARTYAANEKLNIASVGAGGQAAGDIRKVESENIVALCDVDWERGRMTVHSPKTEHHVGGDCRIVPIFGRMREPEVSRRTALMTSSDWARSIAISCSCETNGIMISGLTFTPCAATRQAASVIARTCIA